MHTLTAADMHARFGAAYARGQSNNHADKSRHSVDIVQASGRHFKVDNVLWCAVMNVLKVSESIVMERNVV